MLLVTSF